MKTSDCRMMTLSFVRHIFRFVMQTRDIIRGLGKKHVLRQKLPMALIHEGIGVVLRDPSGEFEPGEEVVMIPNTPVEEDEFIAENYPSLK